MENAIKKEAQLTKPLYFPKNSKCGKGICQTKPNKLKTINDITLEIYYVTN